ncbi:GNAT family N-acetyltransferase [Gordonia sp. PKS22-38]|uniref:GNAT family N-acetyltransferase n=1 Tax=Gordonia prachuapensis TaxID=3115651 RepID=A0ABU7MNF2_9ACTN|nr:GNAT family N-acetyltransferase [Gordonia sp. PKS22-38]
MPGIAFRSLTADDLDLLVTATLENLNWSAPRFDRDDVWARPEFRHYVEFDSARGDFGVVAQRGPDPVGVGWALFLPTERAGYGHVGDRTPEFSLWVAPRCRGEGLGRAIAERLLRAARDRDIAAVSLSVESGNTRARGLYLSLGFVDVAGRRDDGVMVWTAPGS